MTWTKLDRSMIDGPEWDGIAPGVRLVHIEAMLWCNEHGTDGDVTPGTLGKLTRYPRRLDAARQLVDAGLWHETDTGWTLPRFLDEQPSKQDSDRTRDIARQRQRRQRQHRNGDHSLCDPRYCRASSEMSRRDDVDASRRESRVSHDTRTDPSRTDPSRKGVGVGYGVGEGIETVAPASTDPGSRPVVEPPPPTIEERIAAAERRLAVATANREALAGASR